MARLGFRGFHQGYSPLIIPGYTPSMQLSQLSVPPKKRIVGSTKARRMSPLSHSVSSMIATGTAGLPQRGQKTSLQPVSVDPHTGKTRLPKLTIHKEAYPCPHCDRIFSSMSGRFYHMPVHTGQYTYRCPDCQQGFMELSKFKRHLMKKHDRQYIDT